MAYHALQWCGGGFDVGRAGVDVFFVISGVIMWRVTAGRHISPGRFAWRRVTRVAPVYWLATLLVFVVALRWPLFLPEVKPGWRHLILSLAFVPHLDPVGLPFPTLPPGWTLDYEAIFYGVFAACLLIPERRRAASIIASLAAIVIAGMFFPNSGYFMGANPMLLQFAVGVGLGGALQNGRLPSRAWGFGLLLGAVLIWILVQEGRLFSELWRPLVWGLPAALAVAGALAIERAGPPLAVPAWLLTPALALGEASYSIYLFHLPATAVIAHTLGYASPWRFLILATAASITAGLAARALIERPIIGALRRLIPA